MPLILLPGPYNRTSLANQPKPYIPGTSDAARLLMAALATRQGDLSTRALARKLGLPHQTVAAARSGARSPGINLLGAMLRTYPELEPAVVDYLKAS